MRRIVNHIGWWVLAIWLAGFATLRPRGGQPVDAPITVGDLVAFLIVLALMTGLGILTARIASRKGSSYVGWLYYGLLLPYIALPHEFLKKAKQSASPGDQ